MLMGAGWLLAVRPQPNVCLSGSLAEKSMRAVLQRVKEASVKVDDVVVGSIGKGWLVLLGVAQGDSPSDTEQLVEKIVNLRSFNDAENKMNLSLADIEGEALVVSQFTLLGDCRKGRRPGFSDAARPDQAEALYESFVERIRSTGIRTATGKFQAHMEVQLINDGPVTLLLDSRKAF